ncbi:3',5'-cyclic adenosine monophosphate phosphodiesterase CpdA [ANME-1 cluster archaeon GoMg2]|nr:3',5'-cyclic adenosine monophosphate phosphodiesterase CpdA [ANME-1 cluster archaeon GoMg2]
MELERAGSMHSYVGLSDLVISNITWTPSNFTEGQVVTFDAVIANIGIGNTTTDFYTRFLIDDVNIGEKSVAGLDSGNSTNVTQTWTATSGEHTLKVVVDVYDTVVESNETNNWRSKNLSQVQSDYLLFMSSNAESYAEGGNATFSARASRKSSPGVYLSDTEVNLTLAILAENGSVIFTSPMSYANTVFRENVSLTSYSDGNYTARVTLKDPEGVTVEESLSFKIVADFSVSVSTDKIIYDRDEIVHITGSAQYTDGSPISNAPVIMNIHVKGYTRSYSLVTGTAGNFSHYYNPSFMEAGNVTAEASVVSEKLQRSAQTSYTMYGLYMNPSGIINCWMSKNSSENLTFSLRNYGDSDLNGIAVTIIDEDTGDGVDTLLLQPPAATLIPDEEQEFTLNLIAGNVATSQAIFSVSVTSTEGSTEEADLFIHLVDAVPIAIVNPTAIEAGMNPDDLLVRTVNITNIGYESMNDVNISLPSLDWISVTATDLGSIAPGTGKSFDIILHPTNDTAPGVYQETVTITSSNHQPVNIYLSITVTSSQQGDLMFHVINDIGENISGASIVIQNQDILTQVYYGTTNEMGYYLFDLISTGRYNYIVQASGHTSVSNSTLVAPGVQTLVEPVLPKSILGVLLTVTKIQIGDEYDIVLNLTFETEVPPPILIPKPLYIRHRVNFTDPVYETDGAITISNPGLISIFNVTVDSSLLTDVDITFPTGESFFVGELKANSSVTIPYHLHVTSVSCDSDHYRNSIRLKGDYIYFEEYSDVTHNVYLTSEIPVFVNMYDCPYGDGYPIDEILKYFNISYLLPEGGYSPPGDIPPHTPKRIPPVETVHERVKFSISQDATLERDAFAAGLELTNKLTDKNIEGVKVVLDLTDELGSDAADMFFVNQTFLININAIDGTGVINPAAVANIDWLLVPKPGAGGTDPAGQDYSVQAFIDYTVDGAPFSVNSTEVRINVMPQPLLNLTYMVPRAVKADTPFNIVLNVANVGYGVARNLKLDSAQPVIYENQAGLLVAFELIGSGIVGKAESETMLINFGDIAPGESKTGYWIMTASLDGEFTEFRGSFSHSSAVGGAETSLIRNITYIFYAASLPIADAGGPYYGETNETIQLYGTGTDPDDEVVAYAWDFDGDEITDSTLQNPTQSWSVAGTYHPTLKVQDERGTWSEWDWCDVHVYDPNPRLGPYPLSVFDKYYIHIFNIDDIGKAYVNGELVSSVNFGQDSGLIDITDDLHLGDNKINLTVKNLKEGYTYGFEILHNEGRIWRRPPCGVVGVYGCNDNEQTGEKIVYDKRITLELEEREFSDFSFVQLTDVHIGCNLVGSIVKRWITDKMCEYQTKKSVESFTGVIDGINNIPSEIDFVLVTGDLVEYSNEDFFEKFNNVLESLNTPIKAYIIPGNHDRRTNPASGDDKLTTYHRCIKTPGPNISDDDYLIGRDNYTFEGEDYLFIGLDSGKDFNEWDIIMPRGEGLPIVLPDMSPEGTGLFYAQLSKLKNNISADIPKIIFMHHPAINDRDDNDAIWEENPPAPGHNNACISKNRNKFIDYCDDHKVKLVLTGHTHEDKIFNAKGERVDYNSNDRPLFIQTTSVKDHLKCRVIQVRGDDILIQHSTDEPICFKNAWIDGIANHALHVYDSQSRHTGIDGSGNIVREIPRSFYIGNHGDMNLEGIILYDTNDDYKLTVTVKNGSIVPLTTNALQMQTSGNELFNLSITNQTGDYLTTISYYNVSITENTIATVNLNKTLPNYMMEIDYDGDEITDETKDPDSIETNYAPTATIFSPENMSTFVYGDKIAFSGTGTDPEDGLLTNSSLVWTSDIYGLIGAGNEFNTSNLSAGRYNITLRVIDSAGLIGTHSVEILVNAPDLTLNSSDIIFSNPNPAAGESITINATIRNIGLIDTTDVRVEFYDGIPEFQISNVTISTIRAGETETVNVTWDTTGKMGKHTISVAIYPEDSIEEMNETNNQASKSVVVKEYGTNLCGDVAPYPSCNGEVDMGDVILLLNNVSYPENTRYVLGNDWAGDCRCTGVRDMGDVILLLNNVSYPEESKYALDCCD